ncbi:MAG TPA: sodium:proton antiporter, partial [Chthoniobacterales bacterium]|nr:sodium:proton antiporter [Chthoniobacterales bacterium]
FAVMLLSIAIAPAVWEHGWEKSYRWLAVGLTAVTSGYYIFGQHDVQPLRHAALDYLSFIVVVGSFFVAAGSVQIRVRSGGRPASNTLFLFAGAVLANLIGTIGASVLLIRPWLSINRHRFGGLHLAFFIFLVGNMGGALLPTGPPLFLGFLKGVPFFWALRRCLFAWLLSVAFVLLVFYLLDLANFRRAPRPPSEEHVPLVQWQIRGAANIFWMFIMLLALIFAPEGWREVALCSAAAVAYFSADKEVRDTNNFTFAPLTEVAWLFLGIFGTMAPALQYMELHAADLGLRSDMQFFWFTGVLSALLDNAPTYLTFLAAAFGLHHLNPDNASHVAEFVRDHDHHLVAISLAATFFGALTYIGNGPNLLVKAIAEHEQVRTPSFFAYTAKFALPVLLPLFVLLSWFLFR